MKTRPDLTGLVCISSYWFENQSGLVFDWTSSPTDIVLTTDRLIYNIMIKINERMKQKKSTPRAVAREAGQECRMIEKTNPSPILSEQGGIVGIDVDVGVGVVIGIGVGIGVGVVIVIGVVVPCCPIIGS